MVLVVVPVVKAVVMVEPMVEKVVAKVVEKVVAPVVEPVVDDDAPVEPVLVLGPALVDELALVLVVSCAPPVVEVAPKVELAVFEPSLAPPSSPPVQLATPLSAVAMEASESSRAGVHVARRTR